MLWGRHAQLLSDAFFMRAPSNHQTPFADTKTDRQVKAVGRLSCLACETPIIKSKHVTMSHANRHET